MKNLFESLMNLQSLSDAFYFSDQEIDINDAKYTVRSFTYRLATCTDFKLPNALDSRGTSFFCKSDKVDNLDDWKIFARSYRKFFNLGENISVRDYIKSAVPVKSFQKLDGSLIMFGIIDGEIIAKSKTSLNSDQAKIAQDLVNSNAILKENILKELNANRTPIFELVGPSNVIVLRYPKDELVYLGSVNNLTGTESPSDNQNFNCAESYSFTWDELLEIKETSKPKIEGFVVYTSKAEFVKVKVNSYVELHHLKDSVSNIKSLCSLILDDNLDDLLGSFRDDEETIKYILYAQEEIAKRFNALQKGTELIYNEDKHLSRKDYAIKNKSRFNFGLLMDLYLGKKVNYKEFFMRHEMYKDI